MRKALRLQAKTNPAMVEWLHSPIIYRDDGHYAKQARGLLGQYYHQEKGFYHYRSTAKSNFQQFLQGDVVKLKKYLYVLRPLLAVRWIEKFGGVAPIEFERLRQALDHPEVQQAIDALLIQKRQHSEAEQQPSIPILQHWIQQELLRLEHHSTSDNQLPDFNVMQLLNELFLSLV